MNTEPTPDKKKPGPRAPEDGDRERYRVYLSPEEYAEIEKAIKAAGSKNFSVFMREAGLREARREAPLPPSLEEIRKAMREELDQAVQRTGIADELRRVREEVRSKNTRRTGPTKLI